MIYNYKCVTLVDGSLKLEKKAIRIDPNDFPKAGQTWYLKSTDGFSVCPICFVDRRYGDGFFTYNCFFNGRRIIVGIGHDGRIVGIANFDLLDGFMDMPYRTRAKAMADVTLRLVCTD